MRLSRAQSFRILRNAGLPRSLQPTFRRSDVPCYQSPRFRLRSVPTARGYPGRRVHRGGSACREHHLGIQATRHRHPPGQLVPLPDRARDASRADRTERPQGRHSGDWSPRGRGRDGCADRLLLPGGALDRMRSLYARRPDTRRSAVNWARVVVLCHAGLAVSEASAGSDLIESLRFRLRQESDGAIAPCPLEHLLLLHGARDVAPATGPGMRSLREIARQEPRPVRLRRPREVAVRGRGGSVGGCAKMASDRASIMWRGAWGGWMTPSLDRSIQRPAEAARNPALSGADATAQRTRTRTRRRALPTAAGTRNP